jgi:hypothetical protein
MNFQRQIAEMVDLGVLAHERKYYWHMFNMWRTSCCAIRLVERSASNSCMQKMRSHGKTKLWSSDTDGTQANHKESILRSRRRWIWEYRKMNETTIKCCETCKLSEWQKTANGRRRFDSPGKCTFPDVVIPASYADFRGDMPVKRHIFRNSGRNCQCWEKSK